ncbi:MAG: AraC family transcriptional regulator [Bdellovibrionota bacterium]
MFFDAPKGPILCEQDIFDFCERRPDLELIENIQTPSAVARRAKEIMDAEYADPTLTIGKIATRLKLSRSVMSRYFARAYATSPQNYLLRLRVSVAISNRFMSGESVLKTSAKVGFRASSQFFRHFRTYVGTSPSDCRSPDQTV